MRTITINIKYNVGDKVWIMKDNYPTRVMITRINIVGGSEDANGATSDFGKVYYKLNDDTGNIYTEKQLCDTFEQLRNKVFSKELKDQ